MEMRLAQAPPDHLAQAHERGLKLDDISGVLVESMFVADRLGIQISADLVVEPSSSILALRFSGKGKSPLPEPLFKFRIVESGKVPHLLDTEGVKMSLHHFSDSRNFADIQRRKEFRLLPGNDEEHTIRL